MPEDYDDFPSFSLPKPSGRLLFIIIFLTYVPSFINSFLWDDEQFIQKNVFLTSFKYLPQIFTTNTIAGAGEVSNYYRPFTTLSFLVDRTIWGLRPFGFHLTNTLLHGSAAVVLMYFLQQLGLPKKYAFLVALVFGVHPLQTEAVVYMNSRGDSLYTLFLLMALVCLVKVIRHIQRTFFKNTEWQFNVRRKHWAFLCIGLLISAVLAKEIAIAGVGLMALIGVKEYIEKKKKLDFRWSFALVGVGVLSILSYLGLRLTVLNFQNFLNFYGVENSYTSSIGVRLFTFCRAFLTYIQLMTWPSPLHMERSLPLVTTIFSPWVGGTVLVFLLVFAFSLVEWHRRRSLWLMFGFLWFVVMLSPVSGIVPINGLLYEHWLYFPIVGAQIALYGFLLALFSFLSKNKRAKIIKILEVISALAVCVYIVLTIRQNWIWRSPISLYTYTLKYSDSPRVHNNLAMAYDDSGDSSAALQQYLRAIEISDIYPQTHYNLGQVYSKLGKRSEAEQQYLEALRLNPNFDLAYPQLAGLYFETGHYPESLKFIELVLQKYPNKAEFLVAKGQILWAMGKTVEAKQVWQQVIAKNPGNQELQKLIQQLLQAPVATPSAETKKP